MTDPATPDWRRILLRVVAGVVVAGVGWVWLLAVGFGWGGFRFAWLYHGIIGGGLLAALALVLGAPRRGWLFGGALAAGFAVSVLAYAWVAPSEERIETWLDRIEVPASLVDRRTWGNSLCFDSCTTEHRVFEGIDAETYRQAAREVGFRQTESGWLERDGIGLSVRDEDGLVEVLATRR